MDVVVDGVAVAAGMPGELDARDATTGAKRWHVVLPRKSGWTVSDTITLIPTARSVFAVRPATPAGKGFGGAHERYDVVVLDARTGRQVGREIVAPKGDVAPYAVSDGVALAAPGSTTTVVRDDGTTRTVDNGGGWYVLNRKTGGGAGYGTLKQYTDTNGEISSDQTSYERDRYTWLPGGGFVRATTEQLTPEQAAAAYATPDTAPPRAATAPAGKGAVKVTQVVLQTSDAAWKPVGNVSACNIPRLPDPKVQDATTWMHSSPTGRYVAYLGAVMDTRTGFVTCPGHGLDGGSVISVGDDGTAWVLSGKIATLVDRDGGVLERSTASSVDDVPAWILPGGLHIVRPPGGQARVIRRP